MLCRRQTICIAFFIFSKSVEDFRRMGIRHCKISEGIFVPKLVLKKHNFPQKVRSLLPAQCHPLSHMVSTNPRPVAYRSVPPFYINTARQKYAEFLDHAHFQPLQYPRQQISIAPICCCFSVKEAHEYFRVLAYDYKSL